MKNLAGDIDATRIVRSELERCGIPVEDAPRRNFEVPAEVVGRLGDFVFMRAWYYYIVIGNVPQAVAEELYANVVGQKDIRVEGHCGSPAPEKWLTHFAPDGRVVVNAEEKEKFGTMGVSQEVMERYIFDDTTKYPGYITNYHIDSELGLYIFVETLKRHGLVP